MKKLPENDGCDETYDPRTWKIYKRRVNDLFTKTKSQKISI